MALTQTGTLQDLKSDILDALQNRTDVSDATIANYASKAIREISQNYPFEELRSTGPGFALTPGVAIYPITNWMNTSTIEPGGFDVYAMPVSMGLYVDYPNNTVVQPIDYKTPKGIEVMLAPAVQGIPSKFTRFGANLSLGPVPDNYYTTFLRYQARHPFTSVAPSALTEKVFMPLEWFDILAYATAERIAVVKRWNDQATYLHDILYGDPEFQTSEGKRGRPGLISARLFQPEQDAKYNSRQLGIRTGHYNPR